MSDIKQVIVIRKDLHMRRGKEMSQACHASMAILLSHKSYSNDKFFIIKLYPYLEEWLRSSFTKIVVGINSEEELLSLHERVKSAGIPVSLIEDNGATEFHGVKTPTCIGIGPWKSEDIDVFTRDLKLL